MKDIYVKFTKKTNSKEILGESMDSDHKNWIEVISWKQGINQPLSTTVSTSGCHTSERCEHAPMYFAKDLDKSSVYLYEACSAGYSYDVEVQFFRANGTVRTNYLIINLSNAIISEISSISPAIGLPTETFTIKYSKVTWEYKGSKADGSANVGCHAGGWDLALNKSAA